MTEQEPQQPAAQHQDDQQDHHRPGQERHPILVDTRVKHEAASNGFDNA